MSTPAERFQNYPWDTDEKWLLYKSNLCFPEHADHTKLLEKYKLKYYNQNVEKYEPPQQEQPSYTQTTSSSSQSSQQQHQSTSTTSTEQRQTFTQGQQASTSVLRALFSRVGISFTLNLMVLLFSLGGIFPLFRFAHASYRFALISAIFNYAYGFYRIHGLSWTAIQNMMNDVNGQYLLITLVFLGSSQSIMFLVSVGLYSLVGTCQFANRLFRDVAPHLHNKLLPYMNKVLSNKDQIAVYIAFNELFMGAYMIFSIFTSDRNIMRTIIFLHFLCMRYVISTESRMAAQFMGQQLDRVFHHQNCPSFLTQLYTKVRNGISMYIASLTRQRTN